MVALETMCENKYFFPFHGSSQGIYYSAQMLHNTAGAAEDQSCGRAEGQCF